MMLRNTTIGACLAAAVIFSAGCRAAPAMQAAEPSATATAAPVPVAGKLTVEGVVARPAPLAGGNGAVYLTVLNGLGEDVQLLAANSSAATAIELHETMEESGVMRMDPHPEGFAVPAGGSLVLKPGGKHIMLVGLVQPLAIGDTIDLALQFGNGETVTVTAPVTDISGLMGPMPMDMQDHDMQNHGATAEPTAADNP